jgi:peptidyl-prolyl cis-trans isomerase SurA
MNRILAPLVLLAAAAIAPKTIAAQAAQPPATPVKLDAIVAIVNDQPITRFDLRDAVLAKIQRKDVDEPKDSAAMAALELETLNDMIQDELLIQSAKDLKITIADADISPQVDAQIRNAKLSMSESEYRSELVKAGLGTPEDYRKFLMDQYRRMYTREKVIAKLTQDGKIIPVTVSEPEINAAFEREKKFLPKKPPTVTFKQIVIAPQPTPAAKEAAREKADSVLAQIKAGADFEKIAKRESMDLESKETGGDLGWIRRGTQLPEFERYLFGTPFQVPIQPGQMSPVFETPFGFHIIRVDRSQGAAEVKVHQILITAKIDSNDIAKTRKLADSVAGLLSRGTPFDSLAKKYHDYLGREETSIMTPFARDSLPATYQKGFESKKAGDVVAFQIAGSAKRPDVPKFVVAQLLTVDEGGERTLSEMREAVRSDLSQRGGVRRYIDGLKRKSFVSVKLEAVEAQASKTPATPPPGER